MPRRRAAVAVFALAATVSVAAAQPRGKRPPPKSPPMFLQPVAYQQCETSWAFACGMPGPGGGRYGTAFPQQHCTNYAFAIDGTVTVTSDLMTQHGRYRLMGGRAVVTLPRDDGPPIRIELALSGAGWTPGGMSRQP